MKTSLVKSIEEQGAYLADWHGCHCGLAMVALALGLSLAIVSLALEEGRPWARVLGDR